MYSSLTYPGGHPTRMSARKHCTVPMQHDSGSTMTQSPSKQTHMLFSYFFSCLLILPHALHDGLQQTYSACIHKQVPLLRHPQHSGQSLYKEAVGRRWGAGRTAHGPGSAVIDPFCGYAKNLVKRERPRASSLTEPFLSTYA